MRAEVRVLVVLALPEGARSITLRLPPGVTLRDALAASGLPVDYARHTFGIFGKRRKLEERLADGDRVEIYRELAADPKEARRRRARGKR